MRMLKEDAVIAQKVRQVEALMSELGVKVTNDFGDGICVYVDDKPYEIRDSETGQCSTEFPRWCDSERLCVPEV